MNYRAGSSFELSPSDSSDGTYMWDEEGLEPIGSVHPCGSYESSEMNSIVCTYPHKLHNYSGLSLLFIKCTLKTESWGFFYLITASFFLCSWWLFETSCLEAPVSGQMTLIRLLTYTYCFSLFSCSDRTRPSFCNDRLNISYDSIATHKMHNNFFLIVKLITDLQETSSG